MDMQCDQINQPTSHFEYVIEAKDDKSLPAARAKKKAFKAMNQLEGWCTQHKAAVLIDLVFMYKPKVIVEIGVFGGKSLVPMAYALKEKGCGKVFGIDPWSSDESIIGMEGANKAWWGAVDHQAILNHLEQKINEFGVQDYVSLIQSTSENADPISGIGLLHIDGNHSEYASYLDVIKWVPHVKKGGVIVFDDVNWSTTGKAVQWLDEHCVKVVDFNEDCVWGIWVKP